MRSVNDLEKSIKLNNFCDQLWIQLNQSSRWKVMRSDWTLATRISFRWSTLQADSCPSWKAWDTQTSIQTAARHHNPPAPASKVNA